MDTKKCSGCGVFKPLLEFGKRKDSKDGRTGKCKCCNNRMTKEYRSGKRDEIISAKKQLAKELEMLAGDNKRKCTYCLEVKRTNEFYTEKSGRKSSYCISCSSKNNKKTYRLNKVARLCSKKEYYKVNSDEIKQKRKNYYKNNHEKVIAGNQAWRSKNRKKCNLRGVIRFRNIKMATPPWLTKIQLLEIKLIYAKCAAKSKITGVIHHVDHIMPIGHENVSGLHVPWNLQMLTASENCAKGNKYDQSQGLAY